MSNSARALIRTTKSHAPSGQPADTARTWCSFWRSAMGRITVNPSDRSPRFGHAKRTAQSTHRGPLIIKASAGPGASRSGLRQPLAHLSKNTRSVVGLKRLDRPTGSISELTPEGESGWHAFAPPDEARDFTLLRFATIRPLTGLYRTPSDVADSGPLLPCAFHREIPAQWIRKSALRLIPSGVRPPAHRGDQPTGTSQRPGQWLNARSPRLWNVP